MFLLTQQRASLAQDVEAEQHTVGYDDDGLEQQLLNKLNKSSRTDKARQVTSATNSSRQQAQHAGPTQHWTRPLPVALDLESQSSPPASRDGRLGDLLDDLLTQAQTADATTAQQQLRAAQQQAQHAAHRQVQPTSFDIQQDDQQDLQEQQHMPPQAPLQQDVQLVSWHTPALVWIPHHDSHIACMLASSENPQATPVVLFLIAQVPPSAAAVVRSHRQLLDNLLQPAQRHPQQQSQLPPAAGSQPPPAASAGKQQKQKQQKSFLYSTTSSRSNSTPLGHPQRPAPKKKPKFSIRETPTHHTPSAFVTPQGKGQGAAAAAAGLGSGARTLASLLGPSTATPNRQTGKANNNSSRTPVQHSTGAGLAGLFATPKSSSSKPPAHGKAGAGPAGPSPQHTPGPAAATPDTGAAAAAAAAAGADVEPAALFAEDGHAAHTPAAAAAAGVDATTPHAAGSSGGNRGSKRKAGAANPLEAMSASRQRQRAFLDKLPAGPAAGAAAGAGLAGTQLSGLSVPLGANLSKVWQQLQDVRKKQQDRLEEHPDSDAGKAAGKLGQKVTVVCFCVI